ncbi:MAG TPA: flagellar assembly peptidoglycan hydrolase FlgJ [Burkholderiales bacterium]|jgi:flagellar protein FlgJ|nr:flagellar assembly peptidoglycan hydrolase FlgJ [Burkholderiales bacterium]
MTTALSPGASAADAASSAFALDPKALAALKSKAGSATGADQKQALKQAANQFEAMFMNMLLKSMRDSLPKDGMMDSDGTKTYTSMLDQQLSQKLAGKGMGLADMIVKQLDKKFVDPAALKDGQSGATGGTSTLQMLKSATSAAASSPAAPLSGAPKDFVQARWADAQAAEQASGVPAQFILGQAALESGWGKRDIKFADGSTSHNLFGIKAGSSWKGATVDATTTEYVGGVARKSVEKFRAYSSYAESFSDYANLLKSNPRYAATLQSGTDAAKFATSLQQAGYATDPNYAKKLTGVIQQTLRAVA